MANEILILGAGPAGMACAMELTNAGKKSIIIEKEGRVGGLASTLTFNSKGHEFRTDIGPHRFFSKNPYLYQFIENLIKENWIEVPRQTRQFIDGKFYDYPIKPLQAFRNIGLKKSLLIMQSYLESLLAYRILGRKIESFEDYILANFGRKLGEFNMLNYTEKIWGTSCKNLHPDWAKQRIKGLNLINAITNALKKNKSSSPKTLVDSFYYPQYGTGLIYETIAEKIKQKKSKIINNSFPEKIYHSKGKITKVKIKNGKKTTNYSPKWLVSTIPLTEFMNLMSPSPPIEVMSAVKKLKWRSQTYLFITLDKKSITKDNWIYFPNKDIPFGRIAEMKNFSKDMSPKDKTSLFVEFFVTEGDKVWNMSKEELFELAMPYFEKLGFFKRNEVMDYFLIKKKNVYPVYDKDYKENLNIIQKYLDGFKNLQYIGRPGRFRYNNQDHSLEMGILAAKGINNEKKYNMDEVGNEEEYFEKGDINNGNNKTGN